MRDKPYRPGILASRDSRVKQAERRASWIWVAIRSFTEERFRHGANRVPTVPELVSELRKRGYRSARGGPVSFNTVQRALDRHEADWKTIARYAELRDADASSHSFGHTFRLAEIVDDLSVIGEEGMVIHYEKGGRAFVCLGTIGKPDFREISLPISAIEIIW